MCSITGIYNKSQNNNDSLDFIKRSFDLMRHRGPDNEQYKVIDKYCTLGHQRLAIIDLEKESNQPMSYENYTLIFNGEIYNYIELKTLIKKKFPDVKFQTNSDTEVLLIGFVKIGFKFFNYLNGMFAFAVYNKETYELILVRDRFGVKPLHYLIQDDILYFSSEIKPLIEIKKTIKPNLNLYKNFFNHMATDYNEETFIEGIFQLKKGHYLKITKKQKQEIQWYFENDFKFDETIFKSKEKTINFIEDLLVDAIDLRMRSDVPVCITLSGGLDSTTIYTLIKEKLNKNIKPFTFIHPDSPTNEYHKVVKLVDSYEDIVCTVQSSISDSFREIKKDLEKIEFPIWGISTRAYVDMYESIKNGNFKVVLEGHGPDEQLGGYSYMMVAAFCDYLKKLNFKNAIQILKIVQKSEHSGLKQKKNSIIKSLITIIRKIMRLLKIILNSFIQNKKSYMQQTIDWTFDFKIMPIVLRTFDRLSMNSSLESRAPFMDYRIVEVFKKLPLEYKISEIGSKAVLREILKKYKKTYIYEDKQKMGFASDIPNFFNNKDNKKIAQSYIESFNMKDFNERKKIALNTIKKDYIEWSDTFEMSKVLNIAIINEKYKL